MTYLLVWTRKFYRTNLENPDSRKSEVFWTPAWLCFTERRFWKYLGGIFTLGENSSVLRKALESCFYASPVRSVKGHCNVNMPDFTSTTSPHDLETILAELCSLVNFGLLHLIKTCPCITQPTGSEEEIPSPVIMLVNSSQHSLSSTMHRMNITLLVWQTVGGYWVGDSSHWGVSHNSFTMRAFYSSWRSKNPPKNYRTE